MNDSLSTLIESLILAGGIIMFLAILSTRKILKEVKNTKYNKNWKFLLGLMVFFLLGYIAVAYIVSLGNEKAVLVITGIIFFFGAMFVYIVVRTEYNTIKDLENTVNTLEKALSYQKKTEDEMQLAQFNRERQNSALLFLAKNIHIGNGDFHNAIQLITEKTAEILDVERVSVWLYDEHKTSIICIDLYEKSKKRHSKGVVLYSKDYPSYFKALEEERLIDANDAHHDPRTSEYSENYLTPLGITSMLDAPIRIEGKMKGVSCLEHVGPMRTWTIGEESFVNTITDMVSMAIESSQRKKTEKDLEASLSLMRATLEATADGILVVDNASKISGFNKQFVKMWGIPDEILNTKDDNLALSFVLDKLKYPDYFLSKVKELYSNPERESFDILDFKDGRTFERYSKPQRDKQNEVIGRVWSFRDVSDRKRAEEEIRKLNEQLELRVEKRTEEVVDLYNNAPTGYHTLDKEGTIIKINNTELNMLGYSREEMVGKKVTEFLTEEGKKKFEERFPIFLKEGLIKDMEMPFVRKDGSTLIFLINTSVLKDKQGNFMAVRTSTIDITEKKKLEEALRKSEFKYRTMVEVAADVVYTTDVNGNFTYVSPRSTALTGYVPEEFIGKNFIEVVAPEWKKKVSDFYQHQFKNKISETIFSFPIITKTGSQKWVEQTVTQLKEGNWITGHQSFVRDITERVKVTEQLKDSEERFRTLAENAPISIISVNYEAEIEYINHLNSSLKKEKVIGFPVYDFIHPDAVEIYRKKLNEVFEQGKPVNFEVKGFLTEKNTGWYSILIAPIKIAGKSISAVIISLDITDRKNSEEKIMLLNKSLKKNIDELEAANKELESFSYSVSHDLHAPLRAINGFTKLIERRYKDKIDEEGRKFMEIVSENTKKMEQLIDDLLAFSRLGKKELQKTEIDMNSLVNSLLKDIDINQWNSKTKITTKDILPVIGDSVLLGQVFLNLFNNALKYSRAKDAPVIEIGSYSEGDENIYYVKDNGVGFNMANYDKLFKVFQRLHSQEEFEGSGVGLAIVHRIIIRHGGRVWAEGKVNEGATFYFALPNKNVENVLMATAIEKEYSKEAAAPDPF